MDHHDTRIKDEFHTYKTIDSVRILGMFFSQNLPEGRKSFLHTQIFIIMGNKGRLPALGLGRCFLQKYPPLSI
jgi:hypothetical protein